MNKCGKNQTWENKLPMELTIENLNLLLGSANQKFYWHLTVL